MEQACDRTMLPTKDDSERTKRRSLLPKPGTSRYSTRLQSASGFMGQSAQTTEASESAIRPAGTLDIDSHAITQPKPGRLRPRSMYQTSTTSTRQADSVEKPMSQLSVRPPASLGRPIPPANPVGSFTRSKSLRKPGAPGGVAQDGSARNHSRAQSTSTLAIKSKEPREGASTASDRSRSLLTAPSGHLKGGGVTDAVLNQGRMSSRLAELPRAASEKSRQGMSSTEIESNPTSKTEDPLSRTRKRDVVPGATKGLVRPAFSTLQQHFTPRKIGKAPTATFLQPVAVTSPHFVSAEVVSLQCELLQLHMLHESAEEISQQWELSARQSLHAKFEAAARLHENILEYEYAGQEQENVRVLVEWCSNSSSRGVVEHIQALSGPLHDLPSLVAPGGRFQHHVRNFEQWVSQIQEQRSARTSAIKGNKAPSTIEGLGESWHSENMALTRKLASFARDLDTFGQSSPHSSISCIAASCKTLIHGMLDELQIILKIEAHIVETEKYWVDAQLEEIARTIETTVQDVDFCTSAWQH
ncbi:hypothetical protein ACN47E_000436 [Coniothyrium glycines]